MSLKDHLSLAEVPGDEPARIVRAIDQGSLRSDWSSTVKYPSGSVDLFSGPGTACHHLPDGRLSHGRETTVEKTSELMPVDKAKIFTSRARSYVLASLAPQSRIRNGAHDCVVSQMTVMVEWAADRHVLEYKVLHQMSL